MVAKKYDDGGFSGGNMNRPALKQLLEDIATRQVDTVVVYKVDRLTRSLTDFAKIIEAFDQKGVSFVSVTQQFNTTTSMGRLTLNVLLSFAQFEREVTGERIRDKIAASKKKGMWMGGVAPLGYDVRERQLIVNPQEAKVVQEIFTQYRSLGSVAALKQYLDQTKQRTKVRTSSSGHVFGGKAYSWGGLYKLLNNQLYTGRIAHRGESHAGQQEAIIEPETWEKVKALLASKHKVFIQLPQVPGAADGRARQLLAHVVSRILLGLRPRKDQVDLRDLKAGDGDIEAIVNGQQILQFDRQDRLVPAGDFSQTIVGDNIGTNLIW